MMLMSSYWPEVVWQCVRLTVVVVLGLGVVVVGFRWWPWGGDGWSQFGSLVVVLPIGGSKIFISFLMNSMLELLLIILIKVRFCFSNLFK